MKGASDRCRQHRRVAMVSKKTKLNIVIMALLLSLTGCGGGVKDALVPARYISEYEVERNTVTVKKGDLTPFFEGDLLLKDYDEVTYRIEGKWLEQVLETDDVIFDAVYKNVGDSVKAGETLLSFKSESLSKKLVEATAAKNKAVIKKEHLQNLEAIGGGPDYSDDIASLTNDIKVADMAIRDINNDMDKLRIKAEKDGIVSYVNQSLADGYLSTGIAALKIVSDSGYYEMKDMPDASTGIKIQTGDTFKVRGSVSDYDVVAEEEQESGKLIFKLKEDIPVKEKLLRLHQDLSQINDVCYVETIALFESGNDTYVYRKTGEVFRAVKVETGEKTGIYTVIKSGLEEGDVVELP